MRHFVSPTIGPYDYWAIEYGYRVPGKGDKPEPEMLQEIASRGTQPGLDYSTDDDAAWVWAVHDLNPRALGTNVRGFVQAQSWFQDLTPVTVS